MLNRSEAQRLRVKKRRWDEALVEWNRSWHKFVKEFKIYMKMIFDWYFFYQAKSKGEKALHIIMWVLVNLTALRILRFI